MITIYKIAHKLDKRKRYIGATSLPLAKRWYLHKSASRMNKSALSCALRADGVDSFEIMHLDSIPANSTLADINRRIAKWIKSEKTEEPNGFNKKFGHRSFIKNKSGKLSKRALLTKVQVKQIRKQALNTPQRQLALRFNVSPAIISNIVRRKTYASII